MLVEDDSDGRRYVLKATLAEGGAEAVHAEHLAVRHFRSRDPGLVAPEAIPTLQDHDLVDRTGLRVRLLNRVPGAPLGSVAHLSPTALRGLGRLAARSVTALAGFDHPGLHRHSSCGLLVVRDGHNTPDETDADGGTRDNANFKFVDLGKLTDALDEDGWGHPVITT